MKNVLISGASRGIGRATAIKLAEAGYRVGAIYYKSVDKANHLRKKIREGGGEVEIYRADVSNYDEVKKVIGDFCERYGKIYGLVANAGIYLRKNVWDMSFEDWRRTIEVNLDGSFNLVKSSLPFLDSPSSIVFVSSQLAFKGSGDPGYSASKSGVLGLMRSLVLQLASRGIRVNAVAPGTIDTDMIKNYTPEQRRRREKEIPLGRIGNPEDVANVIAFLLSPESAYITGAVIDVNGGLYIH